MSQASSEDLHSLAAREQLARMRRKWRLQHIGWAVIAALVLAGAAGLFGTGPLSATTRTAEGLTVEFARFIRRASPFTLEIEMAVPSGLAQAELSLPRRYLDTIEISSILPRPVQVVGGSDATTFIFAVGAPASTVAVRIHAEANEAGMLDGELAAGSARLPFTQFVWP